MSLIENTVDKNEEIDLRELLGSLVEGRWWIGTITAAALVLGGLYTQIATPTYEVNSLVQVEESSTGGLGALAAQLGDLFETKALAVTEIELIRSRMVLGKTVDDLGLHIIAKPAYFPLLGRLWADAEAKISVTRFDVPDEALEEKFILSILAENRYELKSPNGELLGQGKVGEPFQAQWMGLALGLFVQDMAGKPGQRFHLERLARATAIEAILEDLSAAEKGRLSGIIQLTFQHPEPAKGIAILNQIANNYVRQNVERKSAEAETTLAFVEAQLPEVKKTLEAAEVAFNNFRSRTGSLDITKEGELLLQQAVQADTGLLTLQQQRKELLMRFTPEHPTVKALDNQIASMRVEQQRFGGNISRLPEMQQDLLRLTRDLQVNQELYTGLLNSAQQLRVVRGGTVGNVRVIDFAQMPIEPVKPNKPLIIIISLLFGLMAGVGVVLLRNALKSGVKDANQIESRLGVSVLATIPVSKQQDKLYKLIDKQGGRLNVLAHIAPDDLSIESLRSLRTSLHFALVDATNNVIMITGPSPQVGKSFVSVNLAGVIAAAGQRVLLIDGDMRRGYLNEYFGMPRDGGLSEIIAGRREADDAINASGISGFDYVTTGELPPNPSELLLHPRFEAFLKSVSARYDYVLIDSPPVMAVTDAAIIGRHAGATLLLARFSYTPLREIEHSMKRLQQAGVVVKGILLNRVEVSSGYGYKYAYAYQYGSRSD